MTTYNTIADADIDPESPITTTLMTRMRDNPIAITEGASGAPNIQTAALEQTGGSEAVTQATVRDSAIGQAQLKATSGEVSIAINSSSYNNTAALPGGSYGFSLQVKADDNQVDFVSLYYDVLGTSYTAPKARFYNNDVTSHTGYARQYYVQSSPPYDLGDGEIPLFIFALLSPSGDVLAAYSAPDAPWHYNGPTTAKTSFYDSDGTPYCWVRDMSQVPFTLNDARRDPVKLAEYRAAFAQAERIAVPITQERKNRDMAIIPHPFGPTGNNTVVLLDTVSDTTSELAELTNHDEFSVVELLHAGDLKISNTPLNRNGPPGVPVVSYKWR